MTGPSPPFLDELDEDGFVFPDYDGYCLASVPETLGSLLSDDFDHRLPRDVFDGVDTDVSQVVLVVLDGLGWDQWHRDSELAPLLRRLGSSGNLSPLTTVYPSETAAAITTIHSGQVPAEHGLLGWFQYIEEYDAVLQTLPFTTLDGQPAREVFEGAKRSILSDARSFYPRLAEAGVDAHLYQPSRIAGDTPSATEHPYRNVADGVAELRLDLEAAVVSGEGPAYRFLYVPEIDAAAHHYGTEHARYRAQVRAVTEAVRAELVDLLGDAAADETLLVATADHGLINTDPETNVDLRETPMWEFVDEIPPVGSPRNVQFHVGDPEGLADAFHAEFGDDVRTFTREEYLERELFGRGTCETFEKRAPDLVAVHREKGMLWEDDDLVGMHGGLNRAEMLIPFAASRIADLKE